MKIKINQLQIIAMSFLILAELPGCKPNNDSANSSKAIDCCGKFDKYFDGAGILMGYMIYSAKAQNKLRWDSPDDFHTVFSNFQNQVNSSGHTRVLNYFTVDSLIKNLMQRNSNVNFSSDTCYTYVRRYANDLEIVDDLVWGKIDSDEDEDKMRNVQKEILKTPDLKTIYRFYAGASDDVSVLSHSGAAGLNYHIAYYLSLQDMDTRKKIIKQLL